MFYVTVLRKDLTDTFLARAAEMGLVDRLDVDPEEILPNFSGSVQMMFLDLSVLTQKIQNGDSLDLEEQDRMSVVGSQLVQHGHWARYYAYVDKVPVRPALLRSLLQETNKGAVILSSHIDDEEALNYQELVDSILKSEASTPEVFGASYSRESSYEPSLLTPSRHTPGVLPESEDDIHSMKLGMADLMAKSGINPVSIYAFQKCGFIMTEENKGSMTDEMKSEWHLAVEEYHRLTYKTPSRSQKNRAKRSRQKHH
jgi:hypothetical protein